MIHDIGVLQLKCLQLLSTVQHAIVLAGQSSMTMPHCYVGLHHIPDYTVLYHDNRRRSSLHLVLIQAWSADTADSAVACVKV